MIFFVDLTVFFHQDMKPTDALQGNFNILKLERLYEEIRSTMMHGIDNDFHGGVARHDNDVCNELTFLDFS